MGPGVEKVDCYLLGFTRNDGSFVQIEQIVGNTAIVRFAKEGEPIVEGVALSSIDPKQLQVWHLWGSRDLRYSGLISAVIGLLFKLRYFRISCHRLYRRLANNLRDGRAPAQASQLRLLQGIADFFLKDGRPVPVSQVMHFTYGPGWSDTPAWEASLSRLTVLLDILVQSGELLRSNLGYSPTGAGMRLIEQSERDDRKHRAATRVQIAVAFTGVIQMLTLLYQAGGLKWVVDVISASGRL